MDNTRSEIEPLRSLLTADELRSGSRDGGVLPYRAFLPDQTAEPPKHQLAVSLGVTETRLNSNHQGVRVAGQAIDLFPEVDLRLASYDTHLIPLDRGTLRSRASDGYWDISLSPGKVWSEPADGDWSRAALPFQLFNIFENDTHHGVATFLYNEERVSPVFYQIIGETKAFLCPDNLMAWGWLRAGQEPVEPERVKNAVAAFDLELQDRLPIQPMEVWRSERTESSFSELEKGFGADTTLIQGLVIDNEIFSSSCRTEMGDFPYPRSMMYGIWSATKTAFCTIACLRLAQLAGSDPRALLISDLLPEATDNAHWATVTIGDCLNMASGIGTAVRQREPVDIFADYLIEDWHSLQSSEARESYRHYHEWFLAPSQHEKNVAAFACTGYPWPAGQVARYRDQDLYVAGAALDAVLKQVRGKEARIWEMVRDEVYTPARLHHAIKFHTVETDPSRAVPLSDAGLLFSMDHVARLGNLVHSGGKVADNQILEPGMLDEFFNPRRGKGLPTGIHLDDGEVHYHGAIWHLPYRSMKGELFWIPSMRGYGGQIIQTLPNGTTAFRFGFDSYDTAERYDALQLVKLSDAIRAF